MQASSFPRFKTQISKSAQNWLPELVAEAENMGFELMPWQLEAAELITALNEDGTPLFKEVVITVPRQSGKTTLIKAFLSALAKRKPNLRLYLTAQTRIDALKHLEDLGRHIAQDVRVRLSVGTERITWETGSTLEIIAPTPGGGHGASIDAMVLDEVWDLQPHVMAGVVPATVAKPHSQLVYISTQGTVESEVFNELCRRGRESVELDNPSLAYLEYSAPTDEAVFDEGAWHSFMPALGITQTIESIRGSRDALPINEFIRAFGNRVTVTVNNVFPQEWVGDSWRLIEPPQRFVVALDVNDEPAGASISTGHITDEGVAVRNVEWRYGTSKWIVPFLERLIDTRTVEAVIADFGGPARQVYQEVVALCEAKRIPLVDRKPRELAADTLAFYDSLRERTVHLTNTEPLAEAFNGAHKRPLGEMWLVSRNRMVVDASPLISSIMAAGLARELAVKPKITPAIW